MKFYEGFEDEDTLWLVIEYVSGGDLLDFVINKGGLSETKVQRPWRFFTDVIYFTGEYEASDVALQVCEAMSYLHQQGVAHRDLKPEVGSVPLIVSLIIDIAHTPPSCIRTSS